jgi:RNA polymerase sigma-70 factor, ECF subfamily
MSVDVTQLLLAWRGGNKDALDQLVPLVYEELCRLANNRLRQERVNHTLETNALVNEAYLRLIDCQSLDWQNRAHFFGVAAQLMRNVLVDHARKQNAAKRGGDHYKISLTNLPDLSREPDLDLIALDDALLKLAKVDVQQSKIIELRYFGGLSIEDTAEVLGISAATVNREWRTAKIWLLRELKGISENNKNS